jgi:Flp pilus assembly protein TadB
MAYLKMVRNQPLFWRLKGGLVHGFALLVIILGLVIAIFLSGHVLFGLVLAPILFLLVIPFTSVLQGRHRSCTERRLLNFLHGLHGLTQGGLSLPAAISYLTQDKRNDFERLVQTRFEKVSAGLPVRLALKQTRDQLRLKSFGIYLGILETAYEKGLPIDGLLANALPSLEAENDMRLKTADLSRGVVAQAILASVIPWFLLGALFWFQPELFFEIAHRSDWPFWLSGILVWELAGMCLIFSVARFD